jgi:hypothetical protein
MYLYRFNFVDVKNNSIPKVEYVKAKNEEFARDIFIQKRVNDNWGCIEIFNESLINITCEDTKDRFQINARGHLVKVK